MSAEGMSGREKKQLLAHANGLPYPLALMLADYAQETDPYIVLHRLVDGTEMLTRFLTSIVLADIHERYGILPNPIRNIIRAWEQNRDPGFGQWRELLRTSISQLSKGSRARPCFVPGLPSYALDRLIPALQSNDGLVNVRNDLAHVGRKMPAQVDAWLSRWDPVFRGLVAELVFLQGFHLIGAGERSEAVLLHGWNSSATGFPLWEIASTVPTLEPGNVYLVKEREMLNLFPFQVFADVFRFRSKHDDKPQLIGNNAPQVFLRHSHPVGRYVEYIVLSGDEILSQHPRPMPDRFVRWQGQASGQTQMAVSSGGQNPPDTKEDEERDALPFAALRAELAQVFVGRSSHLNLIFEAINTHEQGIFWIGGKPGIGKSALMAQLATHFAHPDQSDRLLTFSWFFRIGHDGCSMDEFLTGALDAIGTALDERIPPAATLADRRAQLAALFERFVRTTGKTILILLDALDEIARIDPHFLTIFDELVLPGVLWLCAGRQDPPLQEALRRIGAVSLFPNEGLPPLEDDDVREMLDLLLGPLRYRLFAQDFDGAKSQASDGLKEIERPDRLRDNPAITLIRQRSEGLPLYIMMVVEELREGRWTLDSLGDLPMGLEAYYERILERLQISDIGTVQAPIFCLLSFAKEPVSTETLRAILSEHHLAKTSFWIQTFTDAFNYGHTMLRAAITPDGLPGWTLYHDSFRQHLRGTPSVQGNREWAQFAWIRWCEHWGTTDVASLRSYALRQFPAHLAEASLWSDLYALVDDGRFLQAQSTALEDSPNAPLTTIRYALSGAVVMDDPARMVHFTLFHARYQVMTSGLPGSTDLTPDHIARDLTLADLGTPERRVLRHLLLAWEAQDNNLLSGARSILRHLLEGDPPTLRFHEEDRAIDLLVQIADVWPERFPTLCETLLSDTGRKNLCLLLGSTQRYEAASTCARSIRPSGLRAEALQKLSQVFLERGERAAAGQSLEFARTASHQHRSRTEPAPSGAVLAEIGASLVMLGLEHEGLVEIAEAKRLAQEIDDQGIRAATFRDIAAALAKAGLYAESLHIAARIDGQYNWTKPEAFAAIATAQAQRGDTDAARTTLEYVPSWLYEHPAAVRAVANAQANQGDFAGARRTAAAIPDEDKRWTVEQSIATAQASSGTADDAFATAETIPNPDIRLRALTAIAESFATQGDRHNCAVALDAAGRAIEECDVSDRPYAHLLVGRVATTTNDLDAARLHLRLAHREAPSAERDSDRQRALLLAIAEAQSAAGLLVEAERTWDEALNTVAAAKDEAWYTDIVWEVGKSRLKSGQFRQARSVFSMVLGGETEHIGPLPARFKLDDARTIAAQLITLAQLALLPSASNERDIVQSLFDVMLALADRCPHDETRSWLHRLAVEALVAGGDFARAHQTADGVDDPGDRRASLLMIAVAEATHGWRERAAITFQMALSFLPDQDMTSQHADAMREVGIAAANAGLIDLALAIADRLPDYFPFGDQILASIATKFASDGDDASALQTAERIHKYAVQADAYREIATAQANRIDARLASISFTRALEAAEGILNPDERGTVESAVPVFIGIADSQHMLGLHDDARMTYRRAAELASSLPVTVTQTAMLVDCAVGLATLNDLASADVLSRRIDHPFPLGQVQTAMIIARGQTQGWDVAASEAQSLDNPFWRPIALYLVGVAMRKDSDSDLGNALARTALDLARQLPQGESRSRFVSTLLPVLLDGEAFAEAIEIVQLVEENRSSFLIAIGEAAAGAEQRTPLRQILPLAAANEEAAWRVSGSMAQLYPDHFHAICDVLLDSIHV